MFVPLLATLTTYEVHFGIEEGSDKPENEVNYLWHTEGPNKMSFIISLLKKDVIRVMAYVHDQNIDFMISKSFQLITMYIYLFFNFHWVIKYLFLSDLTNHCKSIDLLILFRELAICRYQDWVHVM